MTRTMAQRRVGQLTEDLDRMSKLTGTIGIATGLGTAILGAGEGVTVGLDTPVTIIFGAATTFFGIASFSTGSVAATLDAYASGRLTSMRNFDVSQLTNLAATAAASKVPGLESWAETFGNLAEQAADLTMKEEEACHYH
ncbi:MAG TPA: hypothetical protein VFW40_07965 [Capsulimonadaceae bacterium]|nr:hypothetical protein [Capsulimonadaceae bacterium]